MKIGKMIFSWSALIFLIAGSVCAILRPVSVEAAVKKPVASVSSRFSRPQISHGIAAWYSRKDRYVFRLTANGEVFDDTKHTCAVWDYPFGTRLKVTNLKNNKSVVCRVNDRGPNKRLKRRIDLTHSAFKKIASPHVGVIRVSVAPLPGIEKAAVKKPVVSKKKTVKAAKVVKKSKAKKFAASKIRSKKILGIPEGIEVRYPGKTTGLEGAP